MPLVPAGLSNFAHALRLGRLCIGLHHEGNGEGFVPDDGADIEPATGLYLSLVPGQQRWLD